MFVLPCLDIELSWTKKVRFEVRYSSLSYRALIQTCPRHIMLDLRLDTHRCPTVP